MGMPAHRNVVKKQSDKNVQPTCRELLQELLNRIETPGQ